MHVKIMHGVLNKLHTTPTFLTHRTELVAGGKVKPFNRENACPMYCLAPSTSGAAFIRTPGATYSQR